jgi:hypothetical protein
MFGCHFIQNYTYGNILIFYLLHHPFSRLFCDQIPHRPSIIEVNHMHFLFDLIDGNHMEWQICLVFS